MEPLFSPEKRALAFPRGIACRERSAGRVGMAVHIPTLPDAIPGIETGGSLPATARRGGSAAAIRGP